MLKTWHIVISGFTQHEARISGMTKLWLALGKYRSPAVTVALKEWNAHWDHFAEAIWWSSSTPENMRVCVYAFSWGAGWGFTQLAKRLRDRGITIDVAVLSDPVYRHWYIAGQWRALVPWSAITVPDNVKEVYWFRQNQNLPRGHKLLAQDPSTTKLHLPIQLKHTHSYMDDALVFHLQCLKSAEEFNVP